MPDEKKRGPGRPAVTGEVLDTARRKSVHQGVLSVWRKQDLQSNSYASCPWFLSPDTPVELMHSQDRYLQQVGKEAKDIMEADGWPAARAFMRGKVFHRRNMSPQAKVMARLAREFDELEEGDAEPEVRVDVLKKMGDMAKSIESTAAGMHESRVKLILDAEKLHQRKLEKGLLNEDEDGDVKDAIPADPTMAMIQLRQEGLDETAIASIMGDDYEPPESEAEGSLE